MTQKELTELIDKYLSGQATPAEKRKIEQWYESFDQAPIQNEEEVVERIHASLEHNLQKTRQRLLRLQKQDQPKPGKIGRSWMRVAAVGILFIALSTAFYVLLQHAPQKMLAVTAQNSERLYGPATNHAILTLANGQTIVLDSNQNGVVSVQGKTKITKTGNGLLTYNTTAQSQAPQLDGQDYNSLHTPRGAKFQIVLADGSKVWLNAASTIRFPAAFGAKSRDIQLTGEAYFEIAKDPNRPFHVLAKGLNVNVLGTRFNVMAYENENMIKTTLLEGAVKISKGNNSLSLGPGEAGWLTKEDHLQRVMLTDATREIAWKNNLFWFKDNNIETVMRQLSRWYDIDVVYNGPIPSGHYSGIISRNTNLSQVLETLKLSGIHFKIDNNQLTVLN